MLIILWILWSIIWYLAYGRDIFSVNEGILMGMHTWIPSIGYSKKFMDFKLGSVFNLFLIAVVIVIKHFFNTFGFILQTLFLIYTFTNVLTYLGRRTRFRHLIADDSRDEKKEYRRAMRPYFFANILYVLYTFYLYFLSHYILSIW